MTGSQHPCTNDNSFTHRHAHLVDVQPVVQREALRDGSVPVLRRPHTRKEASIQRALVLTPAILPATVATADVVALLAQCDPHLVHRHIEPRG